MPVIPQYQPNQSLNPQSGARFRAPDTPDLIGPALQQAAAQLKAAATEAEKRQAAEAESEANRRLAKYEYGVTGIMYGRPGEAGAAPTVGYTTLNGQQALDAEPEVRQALADLNASAFDDASTEVADLVRPAISTASTRYERSLATHGNAQAEVARKASLDAATESAANAFAQAAGAGDREREIVSLAAITARSQAASAANGLPQDAADLVALKETGVAVVRAVQVALDRGDLATAQRLTEDYKDALGAAGQAGQQATAAVGDRVVVAAAISEADTAFAQFVRPDGTVDEAGAMEHANAYRAQWEASDPGRAANYVNHFNARVRAAQTRATQTERQLVEKWWRKVWESDGNGAGLVGITDAERVALGAAYDQMQRWSPPGAGEGGQAYARAQVMAAADPQRFVLEWDTGDMQDGMTAAQLGAMMIRRNQIVSGEYAETNIDREFKRALQGLEFIWARDDKMTPAEKAAGKEALYTHLALISANGGPGYQFRDADREAATRVARTASLAARSNPARSPAARQPGEAPAATVGAGGQEAFRFRTVVGVATPVSRMGALTGVYNRTRGEAWFLYSEIPAAKAKEIRDELKAAGLPATADHIAAAYTRMRRSDYARQQAAAGANR